MTYRRGDVREPGGAEARFRDADVVVHLAFLITGTAPRETIRAINVEGTLNAFRAAAAAGARVSSTRPRSPPMASIATTRPG